MNVKASEVLKIRRENFIETRTTISTNLDKSLESIFNMDEKYLSRLPELKGRTTKELLPAMWIEPFDEEAYNAQLSIVMNFLNCVKELADEINQKALEILEG